MLITFFDTKPYDIASFSKYESEKFQFRFLESRLTPLTFKLAEGSDAVCVFVNDEINKEVIDGLVTLGIRIIALRCAGYNNVDIEYCRDKIHVVRVPAYSPYSIAEHSIAMLLTSIRRIHKAYIRTRDFNFSLNGLTGFDLHNKTVGVIGTGRIGQAFINICLGFGMKVIAYDNHPVELAGVKYVSLNTIFTQSDIISLHCPLNKTTYHMINSKSLELMKPNVIIINTSRGAIINAEDLLNAIKSRRIGGACLDVYEEEADIFNSDYSGHILSDDILARLISMPNVIVTAHQAYLTTEALDNIAETTITNLDDLITNGASVNEVEMG